MTAIAPIAWGANYFVTHEYLPVGYPLYGAAIRALPAGLLLLLLARQRPHGSWWWKSAILGIINMGAFFALIYLASQLLPVSLASTIMAISPLAMALFAWLLLAERPSSGVLLGAVAGIAGVGLLLGTAQSAVNLKGIAASLAAMTMSSCGYVLAKKWGQGGNLLAITSWQLIAGGVILLPFAIAFEGAPPRLGATAVGGFSYVVLVATAAAFTAWFIGLRHLNAGSVGLIGLLNPVTGVVLGLSLSGDNLTVRQLLGIVAILLGILLGRPRRIRVSPTAGESINDTQVGQSHNSN